MFTFKERGQRGDKHLRCRYFIAHKNIKQTLYILIVLLGSLRNFVHGTAEFDHELATVLLARNSNKQNHGRFINVRPEVGLLTPTARTFIQEGITTEYATHVIGTVIDNERMYAQLLKSSRIIFDPTTLKENTSLNEKLKQTNAEYRTLHKNFSQSHNDLFSLDKSHWRAINDNISIHPNDYISIAKLKGLNEEFPVNTNSKIALFFLKQDLPEMQSAPLKNASLSYKSTGDKITDQKILLNNDLFTFTIKHHYEPSGYSLKNYTYFFDNNRLNKDLEQRRRPKFIYEPHKMSPVDIFQSYNANLDLVKHSHISSVTYYGFADFTTTVGDSVIVFSPRTIYNPTVIQNANITSIREETTLFFKTPTTIQLSTEMTTSSLNPIHNATTLPEGSIIQHTHTILKKNTKILDIPKTTFRETFQIIKKNSFTDLLLELSCPGLSYERFSINELQSSQEQPINSIITDISLETNKSIGGVTTIFLEDDQFKNNRHPSLSSTIAQCMSQFPIGFTYESESNTDEVESAVIEEEDSRDHEKNIRKIPSGVIVKEINYNDRDVEATKCSRTSQIFLTHLPKIKTNTATLSRLIFSNQTTQIITYLQLQYLQTFDIDHTTKYYCIQTVPVSNELTQMTMFNTKPSIFTSEKNQNSTKSITFHGISKNSSLIQTQKLDSYFFSIVDLSSNHIKNNSDNIIKTSILNLDNHYIPISNLEAKHIDVNEDEEIELLYKTFYTTYTYLTTYFNEKGTSISSHTEVLTHINISTIINGTRKTYLNENITLTSLASHLSFDIGSTSRFILPNDVETHFLNHKGKNLDSTIKKDKVDLDLKFGNLKSKINVKTFYTTYTYYTTIFANGESEILSHTEVQWNFIRPTKSNYINEKISIILCGNENKVLNEISHHTEDAAFISEPSKCAWSTPQTMTEIKENTSKNTYKNNSLSEQYILNNSYLLSITHIENEPFHDQINSEINIDDEILTSATLLLQTSFTTYTYYTTIYTDNQMNVISRLETLTNMQTETLQPITKTQTIQDASLPITYFTTFTYWTKLAKQGHIITLSREKIVSNILRDPNIIQHISSKTKKKEALQMSTAKKFVIQNITEIIYATQSNQSFVEDPTVVTSQMDISKTNRNDNITVTGNIGNMILPNFFNPTTYYTTYTYYTTSYESESAKTRSRLETATNIVTPTITTPTATTISLALPHIENKSKVLEFKKIFDGDGISTLYFTTQIEFMWGNNGEYTELTKTSSSLYINETKKYMKLSSSSANSQKEKIYKTGLVRLIDGTRIGNKTTTLYKSKIIGTLIGQRYAQIIESTSSFIFEKSSTAREVFIPTFPYKNGFEVSQEKIVPVAHNRSLTQFSTDEQHQNTDFVESNGFTDINNMNEGKEEKVTESDIYDEINFNQLRKHVFAPIIPFIKHSRPTFSQKKNFLSPSSATIVRHNELTPTVTATPALKSLRPVSYVFSSSDLSRRFGRGFLKNISQATPTSFLFHADSIISQQPSRVSGTLGFRRLTRSSIRPTYLKPSLGLNGFNINTSFDRMKTSRFYQNRKYNDSRHKSFETDELRHNIDDNDNFTLQNNNKYDNSNSITLVSQPNNIFLRSKKLHSLNNINRNLSGTKTFNYSIVQTKNSLKTLSRFITTPITSTTTTNTLKPQSSSFPSTFISQRLVNNLSPQRIIFKIERNQSVMYNALKGKTLENDFGNDNENTGVSDFYYDDGEGELLENDDNKDLNRNRRFSRNILLISKKQSVLSRVKRKAENLSISNNHFRNRFGRLSKTTMRINHNFEQAENVEKKESTISPYITTVGISSNVQNRDKTTRLNVKYQKPMQSTIASSLHRSIRPTRLTVEMRSKFTLRDKDPTPAATPITKNNQRNQANFRRRQPLGEDSAVSRRSSSTNSSRNTDKRRLKSYSSRDMSLPGHNFRNYMVSRPRNHSNGRIRLSSTREISRNSSSRSRPRGLTNNIQNSELFVLDNKGTITVTHVVPVETSITIVDGKVTKYKKVITAQTNTNILNPSQYTYISDDEGGKTQLIRQDSTVNYAGVTEITKYVLHEIPTTSITFTPTTIRGRKTSFSHIIPSTMYSVESLIMTIQPQIPSNAPLANILLSQLLLGNIGLTTGSNPLLEALGSVGFTPTIGEVSSTVTTPITEFRTHASTYITTVYDGQSTVLSVTFQGKKILTTVYDTTVKTITATELITETIITTPSITTPPIVAQVQPVVNSLLLQQILLHQQQQISEKDNLHDGFSTVSSEKHLFLRSELQELQTMNNIRSQAQDHINSDNHLNSASDFLDIEDISLQTQKQNYKIGRKKSRKSGKSNKRKPHIVEQSTSQESTVITLYVSGRRPGEFSTVLSTVPIRPERTIYKRHATKSLITKVWSSLDYHDNYDKDFAINYIFGKDLFLINTRATPSLDGIKQENSYTISKSDYIMSNVSTEEDLSVYNLHYSNPYTKIKYNSY